MNLSVYVLLLSIWTINSLSTNQSAGSSTTGAKHLETMETKMDSFRRRLLIIIIGFMIIAFVFSCFCFIHYNCMSDDAPKAGTVTKEGIAAKPSLPSKISLTESKTTNFCSLEKQSMLSSTDKLSGPLSPEKSSILSSAEKFTRPSSAERSSIPSSAEKLITPLSPEKSLIPNSEERSVRPSSPEKSSIPSNAGKLFRQSCSKMSSKSSRPKKFVKSSHREKSYRSRSLENSRKLIHAHKPLSEISSSYPEKSPSPPWPARLQSPNRPIKPHRRTCLQNQNLPSKPYSLKKSAKTPRHCHLKRSVSIGKAVMLSKPLLAKICQCYNERCLVCQTSEILVHNISEAKKKNAGNLHSSNKMKTFPRSFYMVDSKDNVYYDNVSDSDIMTYDSNDDSDREIIIICNIRCNDFISNEASKN